MYFYHQISKLKKPYLVLLAILSGILLSASWPHVGGISYIIFFALIPFLWAEDYIFRKKYRPRKVFLLTYLMALIFNLCCTWWIYFASAGGMIMAVTVNSLVMTFFFWFFHVTKRRVGVKEGNIGFVIFWIAFEYCHYHWELSWPWLNLGNVFANDIYLVQWYEYTGILGGTLWVLLFNLGLYKLIANKYYEKIPILLQRGRLIYLSLIIIIPTIISLTIYSRFEEKGKYVDVVIVQPNIDPYHKFDRNTERNDLYEFIKLAMKKVDDKTDFIIGPETALTFLIDEEHLVEDPQIDFISQFIKQFPNIRYITGMFSIDPSKEEMYNAAIQIDAKSEFQTYHKKWLVLGVETIPFMNIFPFLKSLALEMGGTSGTMGRQMNPVPFTSEINSEAIVAPIICYESIYGEHISQFVSKGANLLFIMTNDGWWENTPGHKQHFAYARLRAIETRRDIARSANTGISGFINQRGDIIMQTNWWEEDVIKHTMQMNDEITMYVKMGDYIGRSCFFVSLLLFFYTLSRWIMGKRPGEKEV